MFRYIAICVVSALLARGGFAAGQCGGTAVQMPAAQSGPAQSGAAQPSISGTLSYRERMALPADAAIDVKLVEAPAPGGTAKTVAESVFAPGGKQVPIPFRLSYNASDINPANIYQVSATISVNGKLMFTSTTAYPVLTDGASDRIAIVLQQPPAAPASASAVKLRGTHWTLAELNGKPAEPGEGKTAHLVMHKKGQLSGSTGCNTLAGSYIASMGGLQFTPAATTMKMCTLGVMQQEQAFLGVLKATTNYRIDGETLELLNGAQVLAKFQAQPK